MKVSVSYLSVSDHIEQALQKLSLTSANYIHVDLMDGSFVENQTRADRLQIHDLKQSKKPLDIHLMVENVQAYIEMYKQLKPSYITFHVELKNGFDFLPIITMLHQEGIGVGLSLKPETGVEEVIPYLSMIDLVLIMSVEPGKGGQTFLSPALDKIRKLKPYQQQYPFVIEVDGGINPIISQYCLEAGADIIVVGSYITNAKDYQAQIDQLCLKK